MSYNYTGRTANESPHITKHPGEKGFCREQSMWHEGDDEKNSFRGELNEKLQKSAHR